MSKKINIGNYNSACAEIKPFVETRTAARELSKGSKTHRMHKGKV
ncbi:hypothetical protein [Mongoliibacter sp.]|nr:hypothetical protein [Mongoliibacter sp.]